MLEINKRNKVGGKEKEGKQIKVCQENRQQRKM